MNEGLKDQAHRAFGKAADHFRDGSDGHHFSGSSGVLFEQAMAQTRMAICLSDPNRPDAPIVFSNHAFAELTGYSEEDTIGQNCRFLQGPDTDPDSVAKIRQALEDETVVVVEILNYRKDGSAFWNALHIGPIYDGEGNLLYYFGSQWDVSNVHAARADEKHAKAMSRELSHRMKNMFAVIGSIVNLTGRTHGATDLTRTINDRIQALGRAYEPTLDDASRGTIEVGQAVKAVLRPYAPEEGRIRYIGNGHRTDPNHVSIIGLAMHELATNAIKHGALSNTTGTVEVDCYTVPATDGQPRKLVIKWVEKGGPDIHRPSKDPGEGNGYGHGIMNTLLEAAHGDISYEWHPDGLVATLHIPNEH